MQLCVGYQATTFVSVIAVRVRNVVSCLHAFMSACLHVCMLFWWWWLFLLVWSWYTYLYIHIYPCMCQKAHNKRMYAFRWADIRTYICTHTYICTKRLRKNLCVCFQVTPSSGTELDTEVFYIYRYTYLHTYTCTKRLITNVCVCVCFQVTPSSGTELDTEFFFTSEGWTTMEEVRSQTRA
jgi:hypothetical protein